MLAHAGTIRATGRFAEVAVGMLAGRPAAEAAFQSLSADIVHVVPFFLEDGFFTRIAIPNLILPLTRSTRLVRFCPPVGAHDGIAGLMEARLLAHCDAFGSDPKRLSVVVAGHGSTRHPGKAQGLRGHAARLESGGRFGWVRVAHLEETPLVADVLASGRGHAVAVIGYLANEGVHATADLPAAIAAERAARGMDWPPVYDLGTIGGDPGLADLIVDLVTRFV